MDVEDNEFPRTRNEDMCRQSITQADVRGLFSCIKNNGPPPDDIEFRILIIPNVGRGNNSIKVSPPSYAYEDGVYILLKSRATVPSTLSDRVVMPKDRVLMPERSWNLNGPQYSGESFDLQQRYCTPKGKDYYSMNTRGSMWTMIDPNANENLDIRVFHVYQSVKSTLASLRRKTFAISKQPTPREMKPGTDHQMVKSKEGVPLNGIACRAAGTGTQEESPSGRNNFKGKLRKKIIRWSCVEDNKLLALVGNEPDVASISWNVLGRQLGNRTGKQCRERYINHLRPDRKKDKWTEAEDNQIILLQASLGNQWIKIAATLPGRTDNDVKNRWHSRIRSRKRKQAKISRIQSQSMTEGKSKSSKTGQDQNRSKAALQCDATSLNTDMAPEVSLQYDATSPKTDMAPEVSLQCDATSPNTDMAPEVFKTPGVGHGMAEDEDMLCHDLLSLHNSLKNLDRTGRGKSQVKKEDTQNLAGNILNRPRQGGRLLRSSCENESDNSSNTSAGGFKMGLGLDGSTDGSAVHPGVDLKPAANEFVVKSSAIASSNKPKTVSEKNFSSEKFTADTDLKPPAEKRHVENRTNPSPHLPRMNMNASSLEAPPQVAQSAAAFIASSRAMFSQMARNVVPLSNAQNLQAAAFQAAPFCALHNNQQRHLLVAAQLLSSVNPSMAAAAIAQARQFNNVDIYQQQQQLRNSGVLFPQGLHPNSGFQTNPTFQNLQLQQYLQNILVSRRGTNQNQNTNSTAAARSSGLSPSSSSNEEKGQGKP